MDKSQYKSLDISEQEIGAIRRYISNAHISMNAILDVDPGVINEQQSKGWFIDFSKDGIEKNIEYLTLLYSAMYKYSMQNPNDKCRVYRGTSRREVYKLTKEGISGRFLSTSTDRNTAMSFTEYNNGALLDMYLDGVPYIPTDEFLDENQFSESEILVAPFSIIQGIQEDTSRSTVGVVTYGVNIKKKEFINITDEQKKQCEDTISSFNFEENLARYKETSSKVELLEQKIMALGEARSKDERDELAYMMRVKDELVKELYELTNNFNNVKQSFSMILQDRFKSVELEIERGLQQDKKAIEDKVMKRKIEFERERKEDLLKRAAATSERVSEVEMYYKTMDDEEQELYKLTAELGLNPSKQQSVDEEIIVKFEELKRKIEEIKNEIASIEVSDELTKDDLDVKGERNQKLNSLFEKLDITNHIMKECEQTIRVTKQNNKEVLSREVATKLGQDITSKVREELLSEEQQLLTKKDTLWDKITGKYKVRAAQVENLRLRRQFIEKSGLGVPANMEEMSIYIAKYKAVLGDEKLPKTLRKAIGNTDVIVSNEEREVLELAKTGSSLIPVGGTKKQMLSILNEKNNMLKSRIQSAHMEDRSNTIDNLEVKIKNSVERCLDTALFYTADLTEEQKKQIMQDRMTL